MSEPTQTTAPKRIYLDVCALCRPFDDQRQARVRLETSALELILAHVRQAELRLIVSPVHHLEIEAIVDLEERKQLLLLLKQEGAQTEFDLPTTRQRAEQWVAQGLGVGDAAHLAFAEEAHADFVTVDDRLLKQCRRLMPIAWCGTPQAYCDKENLR
jgi:predicted nucleic acid-binding protein